MTLSEPWKANDIAYTTLLSVVLACAILEWVLWLAAFLYCLIKVFIKAENTSIRILAALVTIVFTLLRLTFLPVMIVTLPLPPQFRGYFPPELTNPLQLFACVTFSTLMGVPWILCIYHLIRHGIGKDARIKEALNAETAPTIVVVMPCYHEIPEVLMHAIDSACDADYPSSCMHLYISFDGADVDDLYLSTLASLGVRLPLTEYPVSIDLTYRDTRITVSRFKHGGKRHCQKKSYRLIDKVYSNYLRDRDDLFILFIDSDIILDKFCIQNFVYEMQLKNQARAPSKREPDMLAMTGIITCTAERKSFLTLLQDIEYVHGQLFERTVESACGSVTCLPGALTMLRFSAFRNMAKYYFSDEAENAEDVFDFGKCHLGEDRWLTHLFMLGAREKFQIQICTGSFCKTEAVLTYKSLLKQRRRWFLGFITNEACMLTDIRLWRMYPLLCIVRFMQNTIRTTALLFLVMAISVATQTVDIKQLPLAFIAVSLGLNWLMMFCIGIRLHRYKSFLYPLMFVFNPFFNWVYMVYGIFTAGQRTWGGPRVDAAGEDEEKAEINPDEVFDPVNLRDWDQYKHAEVCRRQSKRLTIQPNDSVVGRFATPAQNSFRMEAGSMIRRPHSSYVPYLPSPFSAVTASSVESVRNIEDLYSGIHKPERAKHRTAEFKKTAYSLQLLLGHNTYINGEYSTPHTTAGYAVTTDAFDQEFEYSTAGVNGASDDDNDKDSDKWERPYSYPMETDSLSSLSSWSSTLGRQERPRQPRPISGTAASSSARRISLREARRSRWLDGTRSFFAVDDNGGVGGEGKTWL